MTLEDGQLALVDGELSGRFGVTARDVAPAVRQRVAAEGLPLRPLDPRERASGAST